MVQLTPSPTHPVMGPCLCYHFDWMMKKRKEGAVVTVGTFDGVHLGHQAILKRLCAIASEKKLERVAYAFTFPPRQGALRQTLKEQPKPCLLLPESAKLKLLKRYVDRVEQADFVEVRNLKAERFVREILLKRLTARVIVVGDSFRFGRAREGDVSLLRRVGKDQGIFVVEVPSVVVDQAPVSSTWIRELVAQVRLARRGSSLAVHLSSSARWWRGTVSVGGSAIPPPTWCLIQSSFTRRGGSTSCTPSG